jgi:GT2 family glycosyltransferase
MPKNRLISASLVLYNSDMEQVKCAIESYLPSSSRLLYLIDNSPVKTDVASILVTNTYIQYYFTGKNRGYGTGHNIAINIAIKINSQYHVILNPDLEFEPNIIDKIADFMDTDSTISQVMPKILNQDGELQYLCKLIPSPIDLCFRRFISQTRFAQKWNDKYILKKSGYNKIMNPPCLSGCFMFFRMSVIKKFNIFFDERFFMYCEDIDLTRRLHCVSKTIFYPEVSIIHDHAQESYKSKKMLFQHIKSAIKYFNKWGWFLDKKRKKMNNQILREIEYQGW